MSALILSLPAAERGEQIAARTQFERTQTEISATAMEFAELHVLGDVDTFCDEIGALAADRRGSAADEAERVLRVDSRSDDAPLDVLLAAVLISARRGDAEATQLVAHKLQARYLATNAGYVARVAGDL